MVHVEKASESRARDNWRWAKRPTNADLMISERMSLTTCSHGNFVVLLLAQKMYSSLRYTTGALKIL